MPANLKKAVPEKHPDLHRQLGCMSGIFQMFDRRQRHLLTGRQHLVGQKNISSGNMEAHTLPRTQIIAEKNISTSMNEKQRNSAESSMLSLSTSSESSSFSSFECNKSTQPENLPLQRNNLQRRSIDSRNDHSLNISKSSAQSSHHSLDFRDVVKESIYRDNPNTLANVTTGVDMPKKKKAPKHGNSPRPGQVPRMPNESRRSYKIKDDEIFSVSWESKRYSCDSYVKSASKAMKELPRLSLDSKSSTENHNSNVVAKLMGLEGLPSLNIVPSLRDDFRKSTSCEDGFGNEKNNVHLCNSPKIVQDKIQNRSPLLMRSNKGATNFETDPWGKDKYHVSQISQVRESGNAEVLGRQQRDSIHHEINKKLEELEFLQSNKDFRALKQILDAIEKKKKSETIQSKEQQKFVEILQNTRTDESPPIVIMKPTNIIRKCTSPPTAIVPMEGLAGLRKLRTSNIKDNQPVYHSPCQLSVNERTPKGSPKSNASPNHLQTSRNNKSNITGNESSPHGHWVRKLQGSSSPKPPPSNMTNGSPLRTSSSSSPHPQQRKHELKKKSHVISPSDTSKHQKQARQHTKSHSPRGNLRIKPKLSHYDQDQISSSTIPRLDVEVSISSDKLTKQKLNSSGKGSFNGVTSIVESKKSLVNLRESSSAKLEATSGSEQPSPISVLDASVYKNDLPHSPVGEILYSFKDNETTSGNRNQTFLNIQLINPEMARNYRNFKNNIVLVQKSGRISLTEKDSGNTSHFNKLCASSHDPNYPYISEILHATDFQFEDYRLTSEHAINPNLFLLLEKKRAKFANTKFESRENIPTAKTDQEKLQRKLMFDTVDEILVHKLRFGKLSHHHTRIQTPSDSDLLHDLCLEINQLQADATLISTSNNDDNNGLKLVLNQDVINRSQEWSVSGSEVSGLVLNIEKSIFKDLIEEVIGNVPKVCVQAKLSHRRKLFAN